VTDQSLEKLTGPEWRPCPFCGGLPVLERPGTVRQSQIIYCDDCGATVESGDIWGMTPPDVMRWNWRT
jgi:hypothetical protein